MDGDVITRVAESQIQEAIEEGKFDNLPGKGKPLVFDEDPSVPLHIRVANRVLKNAGVAPEWVQFRTDILEEREAVQACRARLARENRSRIARITESGWANDHPYTLAYAEWHANSRTRFLSMLKSVNTSILKFSITAPSTATAAEAFAPYSIEREMQRYDEDVPLFRS